MKALICTGCGCSRMIDINEIKNLIILPVNYFSPMSYGDTITKESKFKERRFKYIGQANAHPLLNDYAMYTEME